MTILGIDPGTATTGYAIIKKAKSGEITIADFGCITTEKNTDEGGRLKKIYLNVSKLAERHKPNLISVESLYFLKNLKTAMPVSQAKGVILLLAAQKNIPVVEITPLQVKMTVTGYGRAPKSQVQKMVKELLDLSSFDLKQKSRKKDDAIDALAVAFCGAVKKSGLTRFYQKI